MKELIQQLQKAKDEEKAAKERKQEIEAQIVEAANRLKDLPERGQCTIDVEGGFKVTVKNDVNFKVDAEAMEELCRKEGIEFMPLKTKLKKELDLQGYEWFRENEPAIFDRLSECVETKPKKPTVSIKLA